MDKTIGGGLRPGELLLIGRKGAEFFRRRPVNIRSQAINVFQALSPETARELGELSIDELSQISITSVSKRPEALSQFRQLYSIQYPTMGATPGSVISRVAASCGGG